MSVHSEVNNLFKNKSGNAPLSVRSRSGDTEDGNEYFDMRASTAPNALAVMEEKDERKARQKFLYTYFTLMKQWLNRFEFEYVKLLYVEGRDEKTIFDMLGLQPKRFKRNLQAKLTEHNDEVQELAERSEWEDAELFSRCFLTSPTEILQDKELSAAKPKTVKGFGNLIEAQSRRERYLQAESDRYYQRKVYMRGFMAGKYSALHPKFRRQSPSTSTNFVYTYNRKIKDRMQSIAAIFRTMSYDFLTGAFAAFGLEIDHEQAAGFERFYRSIYDTLSDCIQGLYQIIVDGVPIEDVEKAEQERRETQANRQARERVTPEQGT